MFCKKKKCTKETTGKLIKAFKTTDTWIMTVEYVVNNVVYRKKEQLTYHKGESLVKIGSVRLGRKWHPAIKVDIGDPVTVKYDPNNPKRCYFPENNGRHRMN